jgi:hypothetical protein
MTSAPTASVVLSFGVVGGAAVPVPKNDASSAVGAPT